MRIRRPLTSTSRLAVGAAGLCLLAGTGIPGTSPARGDDGSDTATPIQHLVILFQENVSFDHYFATYPVALNSPGEPFFRAREGTPSVNGLGTLIDGHPDGVLLTDNPNANNPVNNPNAINPFRLSRAQAATCDQDHNYGHEQQAFDQGLMDLFPATVGQGASSFCADTFTYGKGKGLVMGYFDGNTVTAFWNYAQNFAMSDNSYGTTFGPSTPGLLNLIAGNTYPATPSGGSSPRVVPNPSGPGALVGDLQPKGDVCSTNAVTVQLGGKNIGDLLTAKNVTWGAFMGGFDLSITNKNGTTGCNRSSVGSPSNKTVTNLTGETKDYIPHHAFFQYYASTANPMHTRPNDVENIGTSHDGGANHQYDLHDFFDALAIGKMPAVSFLKAIAANDGHAGYSDPLLEQDYLVRTVNAIMRSSFWHSTAIIIMYDDSDGWYDHQMSTIVNSSPVASADTSNSDQLNGSGVCGHGTPLGGIQGRCAYGPRQPLLVISPFAKRNFVDHALTDQASVLRFIEDNWHTGRIGNFSFDEIAGPLANMFDFGNRDLGERRLILNPSTGQPQ